MLMNYRIVYPNELYHHGIKGMKWGVRKKASGMTQSQQTTSDQHKDKLKKAMQNITLASINALPRFLTQLELRQQICLLERLMVNFQLKRLLSQCLM